MLAMTLVGNELSKEQSTAESGLMTVKGTDLPVQVASSDMAIADDESGALLTRDGDWTGAVGVRAMTSAIGLSSDMPVEFFHDLKALLIDVDHDDNEATPTFSVNFDVNGAGRVPVPWASTGSGAHFLHTAVAFAQKRSDGVGTNGPDPLGPCLGIRLRN